MTGFDGTKFLEERKWLESQEFDLSLAVLLNIDWYVQCTLYRFKHKMFNIRLASVLMQVCLIGAKQELAIHLSIIHSDNFVSVSANLTSVWYASSEILCIAVSTQTGTYVSFGIYRVYGMLIIGHYIF